MNILLTSAGRRTYLIKYFKEALEGNGKIHASNNILTYTLLQADKYVITPNIYDDNYIPFLLDYCQKERISVIISLFDIDLLILSRNKKMFLEKGIKILVSDESIISTCNDKYASFLFLKNLGGDYIKSYLDLNDVFIALESNEIAFPLIIKPRWGMGSIGIYQIENLDELKILYKKLQRDIFRTYLKYESESARESAILIQEMIAGQEIGLEILNDLDGNFVTVIAKKKVAMRSGETDVAEIIDNTPFISLAKLISNKLKHIAILDVDCFVTSNNKIFVLEMNARFGGQYPFSHLAGVNIPLQLVKWLNEERTDMNLLTPKLGTKVCKDLVPVLLS